MEYLENLLEKYRKSNLSRTEFLQMSNDLLERPFCTLPDWWKETLMEEMKKNLRVAFLDNIYYFWKENESTIMVMKIVEDMFSFWRNEPSVYYTLKMFLERVVNLLLLCESQSLFFGWGGVFRKRMRGFSYVINHLLEKDVLMSDLVPSFFVSLSKEQQKEFMKKWENSKKTRMDTLLFSIYPLFFPGTRTKTSNTSTIRSTFIDQIPSPEEVEYLSFQSFVQSNEEEKEGYSVYPIQTLVSIASLLDQEDLEEEGEDKDKNWKIGGQGDQKEWTVKQMKRFLSLYSPDLLCPLENEDPRIVNQRKTMYQGLPLYFQPNPSSFNLEEQQQQEKETMSDENRVEIQHLIPDFFEKMLSKIQSLSSVSSVSV
jgi:hypothetical protein